MQEPSLSELTNIKPEASIEPGVILDSRDAVHQLNQSAQFNAQMKQQKYAQQLDMLKGIYQDLGKIQETPVMDQDKPQLNKMMGDVLNKIAEDPRAALGGAGFNDIQKQLGQLRTLSTTSKQDNIYRDAHDKILESDPELATPENKGKVAQFNAAPIGHRQKFILETPVKFDPEAAMGKILQQKQVAVPYADTGFEGQHNEWMTRTTGTTYRRQSALDLWNQGFNTGTDANNQPIKKWAVDQFEKIKNDPEQMQKFGNPKNPEEFYKNVGAMMYGSKEDIVGEKTSTRTANPYSMLGARQNNALYMEGIKEGNREKLAAVKKNLELQGAPENANFLVRQYANVLGNTVGGEKTIDIGNGKYETEQEIDVPATILKNYASTRKETLKEGHSTDPIVETISEGTAPDLTTRTNDGNLRLTFYKRYDKSDKPPKGKHVGDIVIDSNGIPVSEKTGIVPRRNLMATMGKGVVQSKLLASSIDQGDKFLKNKSNDDIDKINTGEDEGTIMQPAYQEKPKAAQKKTYSLNGKSFTMDQIEKGAKKYKMSVEDYIKQTGMK